MLTQDTKSDLKEQLASIGTGGNNFHASRVFRDLTDTTRKLKLIANIYSFNDSNDAVEDNKRALIPDEEDCIYS